ADAVRDLLRASKCRLERHLLIEQHSDQQRHRIVVEQCVGRWFTYKPQLRHFASLDACFCAAALTRLMAIAYAHDFIARTRVVDTINCARKPGKEIRVRAAGL